MITRALSVTEVNRFIKTLLDSNSVLKKLMIEGEISNLKFHSSGHLYFSLKDTQSRISCVMFRSSAQAMKFVPEEGMKVTVKGNLSVFEKSGQVQVYVRSMEPQGIGALYQAFEQLKRKIEARGWMDEALKKPIPETVETVGIVTSPTGAAIRDMISVIRRRHPGIKILLYPALVQGEGAAESIVSGIKAINQRPDVDVMIIGRGGGSMEDLWAFNEEIVSEAIYSSEIPIISAVGHETDITLSDFVADLRAPTPSAAGELVAADQSVLKQHLEDLKFRLEQAMLYSVNGQRQKMALLENRIRRSSPESKLSEEQMVLDLLQDRLQRKVLADIEAHRNRLALLKKRIEILNPEHVLKRGYALVRMRSGEVITSAKEAVEHETVRLKFTDGEVLAMIVKEDR